MNSNNTQYFIDEFLYCRCFVENIDMLFDFDNVYMSGSPREMRFDELEYFHCKLNKKLLNNGKNKILF